MSKNTTLMKIIAEAKRIQKAHPMMEWKNAIKDASKHIKEGAKTVIKKSKKGIRSLPVNFVGTFAGFKFKIVNQYRIDGGVTAQIVQYDAPGSLIGELTGMKHEIDIVTNALYSQSLSYGLTHGLEYEYSDERDKKKLRDQVKKFVTLLHDDVVKFNKGTDTKIVVSKGVKDLSKAKKPKEFKPREVTKKAGVVAQIKSILKEHHKILKGGYTVKPGKIRDKKIAGILSDPYNNQKSDILNSLRSFMDDLKQQEVYLMNYKQPGFKAEYIRTWGRMEYAKALRDIRKRITVYRQSISNLKKLL
jgi:hypothetical protein